MQFNAITDAQVREICAAQKGKRVKGKYIHDRDVTTIRRMNGIVEEDNGKYIIRQSETSYLVIPSESYSILTLEPSSATSEPRFDEEVRVIPPQPPAEPAGRVDLQLEMQKHTLELIKMMSSRLDRVEQQEPQQQPKAAFGNDVEMMMRVGEAVRGTENPTWRLVPGLILPRFIPDKFKIVSIPHLLYREEPLTGEMVRVPKGTAFTSYMSMFANAKLAFPNQVVVKVASKRNDNSRHEPRSEGMSAEAQAGVRAQIERAERMFADLLQRLDNLDNKDLPRTKSDWLIFIDAGVAILELYSTLANGFVYGGGKLSQVYSASIATTGRFDPSKLWDCSKSTSSSTSDSNRNDSFH